MTYHCDQYFESLKSAIYFWSGTSIIVFAVYWILAGIYTIIDITKQPAALGRYKVQPGTNEQVDSKRLMKVCTECVCPIPIYLNTNIQYLVLEMTLDGLMGHWSGLLSLSASLMAFLMWVADWSKRFSNFPNTGILSVILRAFWEWCSMSYFTTVQYKNVFWPAVCYS